MIFENVGIFIIHLECIEIGVNIAIIIIKVISLIVSIVVIIIVSTIFVIISNSSSILKLGTCYYRQSFHCT